jgi:DNA-binding transcriptional ArsR family regulator
VDAVADTAQLDDEIAKDLVQLFKLLADETRLRILHFCSNCGQLRA